MMVGRFLLNSASPPDVPLAMRDLSFFVRCVCRDPLPPRDPRLNGGNAWIADVGLNQVVVHALHSKQSHHGDLFL